MRTRQRAGTPAAPRIVKVGRARTPSRAYLRERRAKFVSAAIASLLFVVLVTAAFPFGGHSLTGPVLRSTFAARHRSGTADIVYAVPGGEFCRHLSFDNATAEVTESALEPCGDSIAGTRPFAAAKFAWGAH